MRTFFWYCIIMKICIDFSFLKFILVFRCLTPYTGLLSNPFSMVLLTLFQFSLLFSSNSLSFMKNKTFKTLLPKEILLHSTILSIFTSYIKIGLAGFEIFVFQFQYCQRWWWWWWIVFVVWLTNERCLALFPAGTIVRYPQHCKYLTRRE